MSFNTFGRLFRFTSWGESHGTAIGCVIDGCPPRIPLAEADIQIWMDQRKPGQSRYTSQRKEPDQIQILSGVFEGQTTGTPISLMVRNEDARSRDYTNISEKYRPGHADYTYEAKYGIRDPRGGGRASARETAMRVAAGGVARAVLKELLPDLEIRGCLIQIGTDRIASERWHWEAVSCNCFGSPDAESVSRWEKLLNRTRKAGDSIGAVIEIHATGTPAGLGMPVYAKLDQDLAAAMMSINAVKGVEIGQGFQAAKMLGSQNNDSMQPGPEFSSNHAGGILGGISTGQEIVVRFAVKPTSSISTPQKTIDQAGQETEIRTLGRHDPCVGIRAVPVGEAMMACVLLDHLLLDRAQTGKPRNLGKPSPESPNA